MIGRELTGVCHHCRVDEDTARRTLGFCSSWEVPCRDLSLAIDESFALSVIVEPMLTGMGCCLLRMRRSYDQKGAGRKEAGKNFPLKQGSAPWSYGGRATQSHAVVTVGRQMIGREVARDRDNWTPKNRRHDSSAVGAFRDNSVVRGGVFEMDSAVVVTPGTQIGYTHKREKTHESVPAVIRNRSRGTPVNSCS
jgi:hypothetical protein